MVLMLVKNKEFEKLRTRKMKSREGKRIGVKTVSLLFILIFLFFLSSTFSSADFSLKEGSFAPTGKKTYQYVPGEIIVKFKDVATEEQIRSINSIYKTSVLIPALMQGLKELRSLLTKRYSKWLRFIEKTH